MENPKKKKQKKLNTLSNYNNLPKDMIISIFDYIDFKDLFNIRNTSNENKKLIDENFKLFINKKENYFYKNYIQHKIILANIYEKSIEFNFCYNITKKNINIDLNKIIVIFSNKNIITYFILYNGNINILNILGILSIFRKKQNKIVNFNKQEHFSSLYYEIYYNLYYYSLIK